MDSVINFALAAIPLILAITLHEAAHGYAARYFGDPTAWQAGRISLNPLRHIDPVGTLLVPGIILATSYLASGTALAFGWAKPVPVNFGRLRNPKRDRLWVAAAGPLSNLCMALAWTAVYKGLTLLPFETMLSLNPLIKMCSYGIGGNLVLMVLNLLPLPPLDGGRIVVSLLPIRLALLFAKLEAFGFPILLILLFTDLLSEIIFPPILFLQQLIFAIFAISQF